MGDLQKQLRRIRRQITFGAFAQWLDIVYKKGKAITALCILHYAHPILSKPNSNGMLTQFVGNGEM